MSNPLKILLLEDSVTDAEIVQRLLQKEKRHYEFSLAMDKEAYELALEQFKPDVILADNSLPQFSAAEALAISRRRLAYTPFIMVTDMESEEFDTGIIRSGADDYILKDRLMRLPVAIDAALRQQNAEKEKVAAIEKLNRNEENYRNLVERISDGFIALDMNWHFTYLNKKAEQLFRRPPGYLIGKHIWTEFPETVDQPFYKAYHKAMETQENISLKEYSTLIDKWVEANIYPSLSGITIYFRDITEQKKAEEKLREREEQLRLFVEHSPAALAMFDKDMNFVVSSRRWAADFKLGNQTLAGRNMYDIFPETPQYWKDVHQLCLAGSVQRSDEDAFIREDGSIDWARWEIRPWYNANGSIGGIISFAEVITDKKNAELKIKENEEKYHTLVEHANDGIFIADSNGNLLDANSGLCTMLGAAKEDILQSNLRDGLFEEDLKNNPIGYDELKKGLPLLRERKVKKFDGSALFVEISCRMLPDGQIQGIVRDISERKKKEDELKKSEQKYRNLIEQTSDGIVIYSLDGTIIDFNHSSYGYVGYTKEEISHLNIKDFFFDEDLKKNPLTFERLKAGYSTIDQRRLKRKDGSPVEMEISTTMLPDGNLMAFARDITERRRMEEEQRHNLEELAAIYKLSNSLNRASTIEEIFTEAMNSLHDTIHTDRTSILLFDKDGVMRFKAWCGLSDEYRRAVEGHSPWSKDTKNVEPIFIFNTDDDADLAPWQSSFKKEGISALGFIPIMQNGNLLGKFMLYSNTPRLFSARESQLAQNIASHVAFAIDRQKKEEELRLKENAISTSISGMGMTDLTGKIIYANEALGKMWGCTDKNQLLGKKLTDVFEGSRILQTIEALQTKGFENGEDVGKKIDGTLFNVAFSANVTMDKKGHPVCMFGSFIDITERKKAETEIVTEKLLSDSIINSLPGIFYLYDENGKFLRWNKNFETVTGYNSEEIKKMHPLDFYDTDQKGIIRKRIETVFKEKVPGIEALLFTKGRKKIPFFYNSLSINYEGRPCLIGIGIDMSEQKKAQEEIRLSHERYETVSKATSDAIWDYDFTTGKTYIAGAGYKHLFGYDLINQYTEELFWESRLHPDDKERILTELNNVIADPHITQSASEYRFLKADGSYAYVYDRLFIIRENGKPVRMLGSKQDITSRKKAEVETRRSNERFEMVARATNDAVWDLDLLTGESWHNETFLLLFGADPYGNPIKPTTELWRSKLHPDDRERVLTHLHKAYADTSSIWADEFRFLRADGSYGIFYDRGFIERDEWGKAIRITGSMIDITELKKIQGLLRESEEKYRNLVEEASDAIFINDKQGRLLDANKSAVEMLGYTKEQLCNMKVNELYSDEELAARPIMFKELLNGERTSLERNMQHSNGSQIPVDITAKMLADGRIIAIARDNRERKKAEEVIRRSNDRFQTLSKATKDAVWDWDILTDEVWWNESFYNILGFDPKLPVPPLHEWIKKVHPDDRDQIVTKLKKVREDKITSWEDEFRFQLADGSYGTALERAYLLRDDAGKPVRVIGALMDITERKKIMKEMNVLSMIAKETSNGVLIFDTKNKQVTWVNEGFTRLTGYTLQDMYGKEPKNILYGPETDQQTIKYINSQREQRLPFSVDILIYTKQGEKRWHYITGQPMADESSHNTNYFVLSTDISDRLRMEHERLANKIKQQKEMSLAILHAQESERNELGRELHDNINQILAAINIKLDYYIKSGERNIKLIADCYQNVQDAIKETRNLSHRMVMPRFSESSLQNTLVSLADNYNSIQTIQLDTDKMEEKEFPVTIKATLFRIAQEQLSNIQKHAKADKVSIHISNDPEQVTMTIEDNGIGFDMRQKRKGIGISNIFNRVELYNGKAEMISSPGKGCTLSVNIPLAGLNEKAGTNSI